MFGKIIAWIKGHLAAVLSIVVIVVVLPTAWFVSSGMGRTTRENLQKKVEAEFKKVDRQNVTYRLPAFEPGMEEVELSRPPNEKVTRWFSDRLAEMQGEVQRVTEEAIAFNKRDHEPLVEGLFPEPTNEDDRRLKPYEFLRLLYSWRGRPSIGERLVQRINGGTPPDPIRVATKLQDERTRFIADLERQRGPGQDLSAEEEEALREHLMRARIGEYERQARRLSVYADPEQINAAIEVPDEEPATPPSLSRLFELQWNVWIAEDILDAIALANTDERGRPMRVNEAPVKRIMDMRINLGGEGDSAINGFYYEGAATVKDRPTARGENGLVGTRDEWSLTGRYSHPDNQLYDVIEVKLVLIVDAERLPKVLDAFPATNFMSVLDLDLESVDVWKDLRDGYVYGSGSILKATMTVETVWLRAWTAPLMPPAFREALGVEGFEGSEG